MGWKRSLGAGLTGFTQGISPFLQMKLAERAMRDKIALEGEAETGTMIKRGELVETPTTPMYKPKYQYKTGIESRFDPKTLPGLQGVNLQPTTGQTPGTTTYQGKQYMPSVKYGETAETWREKQTFEANERIREAKEKAKLKTEKPTRITDEIKDKIIKKVYLGQPLSKGEQQIYNDIIKKGSLLEGLLGGGEIGGVSPMTESQYNIGDIISQDGMKYKVVGFDTDGEPLVEPVR